MLTFSLCYANGMQEEMTSALATMRVDYDQVKIKLEVTALQGLWKVVKRLL